MTNYFLAFSRISLGFIFLIAGINGYFVIFNLEPFIATSPEAMALFEFQYLLIIEKALEIICGLLLLSNRFIPFALSILAPITTNILLLHIFLDHSLLLLAILIVALHAFMFFCFRKSFSGIFEKKPSL
ncbi:hypothetical protein [Radiobacillus deserti]|uniref:DoxX family membrane protein n=1 Tax=Radiobacillus deserti TaxID=2594883 RepID=A0A516KDP4_9BACI|nr:hypothetical protein [Radiobacillus deserti]QDP39533.1 hypothetical protein FN924_04685 [Radiobacillus deserti]